MSRKILEKHVFKHNIQQLYLSQPHFCFASEEYIKKKIILMHILHNTQSFMQMTRFWPPMFTYWERKYIP